MLQINNLSKSFQDQILFMDATFSISRGEKVGVVGRNGSGKSTLFKIIQGESVADEGDITMPNNYKIGSISQHIVFSHNTVIDECMSILGEEQKLETYRAEKLLSGLGFEKEDFAKDPLSFSGGYQVRINLVKALLGEPNLLLLDEPTNYLDISSIDWLINFLRNFPGEVLLITHDRSFMDKVCNTIVGIHNYKVRKIKGTTLNYYQKLKEEEEILLKTADNIKAKRAQLEDFITKFKAKASKASQAKSKQKQLDRMEEVYDLEHEQNMNLNFVYEELNAKKYLFCENLSFGYDPSKKIFNQFNLTINKGDKIGIVGKNGKGKSTLLNLLYKNIKPNDGEVNFHDNLKIGYFGQTNIERLNLNSTIVEEVIASNPDIPTSKSRALCGAMMFTKDQADKKISVLSGGEKSRVLLAKVMAMPTNMLFLDEPTNHLDMESIDIFKQKLIEYQGSLLIVSHSVEFMSGIVNKIIYFKNNDVAIFDGTVEEFESKIGLDDDLEKNKIININKKTKKEIHALRQVIIKEKAKIINPLEKEFNQISLELEKLEEKENQITKELNSHGNDDESNNILSLSKEIGEIHVLIEEKLEYMSELEEKINNINEDFDKRLNEV